MQKEKDELHTIPVIDCPECKAKDIVLHAIGPFEDVDNGETKRIWHCPNCGYVPSPEEIKGYASLEDAESMEADNYGEQE